jgi:hypothetical protein
MRSILGVMSLSLTAATVFAAWAPATATAQAAKVDCDGELRARSSVQRVAVDAVRPIELRSDMRLSELRKALKSEGQSSTSRTPEGIVLVEWFYGPYLYSDALRNCKEHNSLDQLGRVAAISATFDAPSATTDPYPRMLFLSSIVPGSLDGFAIGMKVEELSQKAEKEGWTMRTPIPDVVMRLLLRGSARIVLSESEGAIVAMRYDYIGGTPR